MSICVNLRLIAPNALRYALCAWRISLGVLFGAGSRTRTGTGLAALGILSLALHFSIGTYHTTTPQMKEFPASTVVGMCHWSGMVRAQNRHSLGTAMKNIRNLNGLQNPTGLLIT